jgi:hypothetical protein
MCVIEFGGVHLGELEKSITSEPEEHWSGLQHDRVSGGKTIRNSEGGFAPKDFIDEPGDYLVNREIWFSVQEIERARSMQRNSFQILRLEQANRNPRKELPSAWHSNGNSSQSHCERL